MGLAAPGASLDHATLTIASAVDADFSQVASMDDVDLSGANLGGARLEPARMRRAWLANAEGLDATTARSLQRQGGVLEAEDILELVDARIVDGFRAQIEANQAVAPEQRRAVLLDMLQSFYQQ